MLPPSLAAFVSKRIQAALRGPADVPALIAELVKHAPAGEPLNMWVHHHSLRAERALAKDEILRQQLLAGEVGLIDAVRADEAHSADAEAMYTTITGHHSELRSSTAAHAQPSVRREAGEAEVEAEDPMVTAAWRAATSDASALREYADAAGKIGSRRWVRDGIDWCVGTSRTFFREGGGSNLARREATRLSYASRGLPLEPSLASAIVAAAEARGGPPPQQRIRLLDVGACQSLFDGYDDIDPLAVDLCPHPAHPSVLQCDFLELGVTERCTPPAILPSNDFPAGALASLPAASFDVVVLSLVLSYLPLPRLRGAMIAKARRLLPTPDPPSCDEAAPRTASFRRGLLLVVDTFSLDQRRASSRADSGSYLRRWVEAVEGLGFTFLRHTLLPRSHALAFATAPRTDEQLDMLAVEPPPEMVLRAEVEREARDANGPAGSGGGDAAER